MNEMTWAADTLQLQQLRPRVTEEMIVAIDPGDLNRVDAPTEKGGGRVRDGDRSEIVDGVTTRPVVRGRRQSERLIKSYLDRWACEEVYCFTKQGLQMEREYKPGAWSSYRTLRPWPVWHGRCWRPIPSARGAYWTRPTGKSRTRLYVSPFLQPAGRLAKAVCYCQDNLSPLVARQENHLPTGGTTNSGPVRMPYPSSPLTDPRWGVKNWGDARLFFT